MPAFCVTFSQPCNTRKYWICNVERRKIIHTRRNEKSGKRKANDDSKDEEKSGILNIYPKKRSEKT